MEGAVWSSDFRHLVFRSVIRCSGNVRFIRCLFEGVESEGGCVSVQNNECSVVLKGNFFEDCRSRTSCGAMTLNAREHLQDRSCFLRCFSLETGNSFGADTVDSPSSTHDVNFSTNVMGRTDSTAQSSVWYTARGCIGFSFDNITDSSVTESSILHIDTFNCPIKLLGIELVENTGAFVTGSCHGHSNFYENIDYVNNTSSNSPEYKALVHNTALSKCKRVVFAHNKHTACYMGQFDLSDAYWISNSFGIGSMKEGSPADQLSLKPLCKQIPSLLFTQQKEMKIQALLMMAHISILFR